MPFNCPSPLLLKRASSYLPLLDKLCTAQISLVFWKHITKFNLSLDSLLSSRQRQSAEIKETAQRFRDNYAEDIHLEFADEIVHFKYIISQLEDLFQS